MIFKSPISPDPFGQFQQTWHKASMGKQDTNLLR